LSDVVRKAKTEGSQPITVHGREEVGVVSVDDDRRAKREATGEKLVSALRESPLRGVKIERPRLRSRVRAASAS